MAKVLFKDVAIPMISTLLKDEGAREDARPQVGQTARSPRYDDEDFIMWWNNGLMLLSTLKPLRRHQIYKDDGQVVPLPRSHYRPLAVVLPDGATLPRSSLEREILATGEQRGPCYYLAEDQLVIANINPRQFTYFYYGFFPKIEDVDSSMVSPEWAWEALANYTAMQALTREAIADARYRKFITRTDAGNPQHNPFLPVVKWMEERFYRIIQSHVDNDEDLPK